MVALGSNNRLGVDHRAAPREEVYHRTRARTADGKSLPLQIVNLSSTGFMARTEAELASEAALSLRLPVVGECKAVVRWAMAGRIGCQFTQPIDLADYLPLIGALAKTAS